MVDIETTGLSPDHSAIIQITAIRFSLEPRTIDHGWFDQCLRIPPSRFWDQGTREFWIKHMPVFKAIQARMRDPREVIREFYDWAGGSQCQLHFWSKPLSFDFPIIQSYFREFELPMPFDFRKGRDLRTHIAAVAPQFDERSVPFEGDVHNSLFDTLHQIKMLYAAHPSGESE